MKTKIPLTGLCVLVLLGTGCTSNLLEFDRMTGTAYPQDQTVSGSTVSLESIYVDGGVLLKVEEDDQNIAPLTTGVGAQKDCITNAELDALESANRDKPVAPASWECSFWIFDGTCTEYYAYGIVVDHYATYSDGSCKTGTLGRMWTSDNRQSFAIFYSHGTIQSDAGKYLRTTAHELGHAFNLHHSDGDGSSTIMNQTSVVGSSYTYTFSTNSETHLQEHPDECVHPGTGSFTSVNAEHDGWHSGVSDDCGS